METMEQFDRLVDQLIEEMERLKALKENRLAQVEAIKVRASEKQEELAKVIKTREGQITELQRQLAASHQENQVLRGKISQLATRLRDLLAAVSEIAREGC